MHLDHDHDDSHIHEHEHEHEHEHGHEHEHEHEHEHSHTACGEPIHCGEGVNCADCGREHVSPREELMALMKYMVGHNASHAAELAKMAEQLKELGETAAYEQIMQAVSDFEKGNLRLSTVLASMTK